MVIDHQQNIKKKIRDGDRDHPRSTKYKISDSDDLARKKRR